MIRDWKSHLAAEPIKVGTKFQAPDEQFQDLFPKCRLYWLQTSC